MTSIGTIARYSAYELAKLAGCGYPDDHESAGGLFLTSIRGELIERLDEIEDGECEELLAEIAENAPDVYTNLLWRQFVDLAAYLEDLPDSRDDWDDMARATLCNIAYRLLAELWEQLSDQD
jgi:hypothetical protein